MTASERDCAHGQLARSCDRCADAREIAELRDEADNLRWELDATKRAREKADAECARLRSDLAAERERMIADGWRQTRYVAPVTDCEACLTPDACGIRGQCGHYLRERA